MRIDGYKTTARDAAEEFAKTAWEEPRQVGRFEAVKTNKAGAMHAQFQLVHGVRWYGVWLTWDYASWSVEPIEEGAALER